MTFYLALFAILSIFGYLICKRTKFKYRNEVFIILAFGLLCFLSAIRYDVGFDYSYGGYTGLWSKVQKIPISEIMTVDDEFGFTLFAYFLSIFGKNYQIFYAGTSILVALLAALFVYKYCEDKAWGFFLIYGLGMYYCSMNLIRQTVAMLLVALAVPLIKKKKIIPYMLLVLIAATCHKSALLMIPFYFVLRIKITKRVLALYAAATAGIFLTSDIILRFVTKIWYGGYVGSIYLLYGNDWYYLIAPAALFILVFIYREKICEDDSENYVFVNCAFFNLFFWLISWKHLLVDRFTVYFEPAVIICVCILMKKMYNDIEAAALRERSGKRKKYMAAAAVVMAAGIISNVVGLKDDGHGIIPYDNIFRNPEFKMYSDSLSMDKEGAVTAAPEIL